MESFDGLTIHKDLRLKGDLTTHQSVCLETRYIGKIKTKKQLIVLPTATLQGEIKAQSVDIEPGAQIDAEIQIGSSLTQWFKPPRFLKKLFSRSHE